MPDYGEARSTAEGVFGEDTLTGEPSADSEFDARDRRLPQAAGAI